MKKIAVVTTTRAEYGLLRPVIWELRKHEDDNLKIDLLVSGTHLSEKFGLTVNEIKKDGLRIDYEIPISLNTGSLISIAENQADALVKFANIFSKEKYDAVILLGDRYEMLAVAVAASDTQTPIFHISGGDITEGAIDESIRHSITKMSYLHFPTNEDSRKRIVQLGEDPKRVFNYGSTSIDNIKNLNLLSKQEAMQAVNINNGRYALCTYHPVTLEKTGIKGLLNNFFEAIKSFPDIDFIITKSNADCGGEEINSYIDEKGMDLPNLHIFASLGVLKYLSLMKYALFVLGNSSSGIIETPAFGIPTINIGDRQKGRLRSSSIIDCKTDCSSIVNAISLAISEDFQIKCRNTVSAYGDGTSAVKIAKKCIETVNNVIDLKKSFYDME